MGTDLLLVEAQLQLPQVLLLLPRLIKQPPMRSLIWLNARASTLISSNPPVLALAFRFPRPSCSAVLCNCCSGSVMDFVIVTARNIPTTSTTRRSAR